jgi:hypothetical protein
MVASLDDARASSVGLMSYAVRLLRALCIEPTQGLRAD